MRKAHLDVTDEATQSATARIDALEGYNRALEMECHYWKDMAKQAKERHLGTIKALDMAFYMIRYLWGVADLSTEMSAEVAAFRSSPNAAQEGTSHDA